VSRLSREQRRKFPPVCPEFVIEVMSRSDRLKTAQKRWKNGFVPAFSSAG